MLAPLARRQDARHRRQQGRGRAQEIPGTSPLHAPGDIRLWDVATGRRLAVLPTPDGRVMRLAFSPDGKTLAAATRGRRQSCSGTSPPASPRATMRWPSGPALYSRLRPRRQVPSPRAARTIPSASGTAPPANSGRRSAATPTRSTGSPSPSTAAPSSPPAATPRSSSGTPMSHRARRRRRPIGAPASTPSIPCFPANLRSSFHSRPSRLHRRTESRGSRSHRARARFELNRSTQRGK